jgi:hypothetical protein
MVKEAMGPLRPTAHQLPRSPRSVEPTVDNASLMECVPLDGVRGPVGQPFQFEHACLHAGHFEQGVDRGDHPGDGMEQEVDGLI